MYGLPASQPQLRLRTSPDRLTVLAQATAFAIRANVEGTSILERTKLRKLLDSIQTEMMMVEEEMSFAKWEPGSSTKLSNLKILMATLHKVHANLRGMQHATTLPYVDSSDRMRQLMNSFAMRICDCLEGTIDFVLYDEQNLDNAQGSNSSANWLIASRIYVRERLEAKVEDDIKGYKKLTRELTKFEAVYSDMRRIARMAGETLDKNEVRNVFLCSVKAMSASLISFPEEYAEAIEAKRAESNASSDFVPESNEVTITFEKRDLIAAVSLASAVILTMLINWGWFDCDSLAPVVVAYAMAGHAGPAFSVTSQRVMGFMVGMILSQMVISASQSDTECNPFVLAPIFACVMTLCAYIRASSPMHAYDAVLASLLVSILCLTRCGTSKLQQFETIQQVVIASLVIGAVETLSFPFNGAGSNLRRLLMKALVEMHTSFNIIFESHLTEAWEEMERKREVAKAYAEGRVEEFQKAPRSARVVDNSLWRNLYVFSNALEGSLQQWQAEPSLSSYSLAGYDSLLVVYREMADTLCTFQNHVMRMERQRNVHGRQLLDELKPDLKVLHNKIGECFDELATVFVMNRVDTARQESDGEGSFPKLSQATASFLAKAQSLLQARLPATDFQVGDIVEADFKGEGRWLKGVITRLAPDGVDGFDLQYGEASDGVTETGVRSTSIRDAVLQNDDLFGFHTVCATLQRLVHQLEDIDSMIYSGAPKRRDVA